MTQSQNKGKSHPAAVILTFCIALWQMWHFGNQFQGSVALFIWRQSTLVPFQGIDGRTREDSNLLLWHACDSRLWITFFKEEKNLIKHCTSTYMSYRHGQYIFMAQCFQLLLQIFKFCTSFPHHFTEKKKKKQHSHANTAAETQSIRLLEAALEAFGVDAQFALLKCNTLKFY